MRPSKQAMGFEATIREHQRRVFSYAHYFLGNPEEAEDVAQEVFLRLWRHWQSVDADRVGSWLLRVTRNACYDQLRKRRSTAKMIHPEAGSESVESARTNDPDPESVAAGSDFRRHLLTALRRLDEPQRSVLILREIQGLKYTEISDALELPLNTVRVYLHRGRKKLREQLKESFGYVETA
ncbi:MAG: RNA polymerase sigma factor [Thermoanaerobaculia bacterium]